MQNKQLLKLLVALLTAATLSACNGGSSTASASNNAVQTNQLQQYINSLTYTPINPHKNSKNQVNLTSLGNQQSFFTPGNITINSVNITYYSDAACTGTATTATTLNGPVTPESGTYTSSDQSNFALCSLYPEGCEKLMEDLTAGTIQSLQYTYNTDNVTTPSIVTPCMYNANNKPTGAIESYEGIANYTNTANPVACTSGSSCGFSQQYNTRALQGYAIYVASNNNAGYNGDLYSAAVTRSQEIGQPAFNGTTGLNGADYLCNTDTAKPTNQPNTVYKAMIGGTNRAPLQSDWVLYTQTIYNNAAGEALGSTVGEQTLAIVPNLINNNFSTLTNTWTGLNGQPVVWSIAVDYSNIPLYCTGANGAWSSSAAESNAAYGNNTYFAPTGPSFTLGYISGADMTNPLQIDTCNTYKAIYCAQQ
jgi:hypothetical protein